MDGVLRMLMWAGRMNMKDSDDRFGVPANGDAASNEVVPDDVVAELVNRIPAMLERMRRFIRALGSGLVQEAQRQAAVERCRDGDHENGDSIGVPEADGILLSELDVAFETWCHSVAVRPEDAVETLDAVAVTFGEIFVQRFGLRWVADPTAAGRTDVDSAGLSGSVVARCAILDEASGILLRPGDIVRRRVRAGSGAYGANGLLATYLTIRQHLAIVSRHRAETMRIIIHPDGSRERV